MRLSLSVDLTNFRADRPSEWKMDEYISKAIELEDELALLKGGQGEPVAWPTNEEVLAVLRGGFIPELFTQAPTIPEGWQLVPIEPTPEMLLAYTKCRTAAGEKWATHQYKAMLSAAPKQGES